MGEPLAQRKRRWKLEMARSQRYRCVYCWNRFPLSGLTFDHVKPLKDGGTWGRYNLVLACHFCNNARNPTFLAEKRRIQESGLSIREYRRQRHVKWLDSNEAKRLIESLLERGKTEAVERLRNRYGGHDAGGSALGDVPEAQQNSDEAGIIARTDEAAAASEVVGHS